MTSLATLNLNPRKIANQSLPPNGIKMLPLPLDFTAQSSYAVDLSNAQMRGFIDTVQVAYIDNSANNVALTLQIGNPVVQTIKAQANTQGYYPITMTDPPYIVASCPGGSAGTLITLINVPLPPIIWTTAGGVALYDGAGNLKTADQNIAPLISGSRLKVNVGTALAPVSHSGTIAAANTSQVLMAANANRNGWRFQNLDATADIWFNDLGGAAAIAGTDSFKVAAGQTYESPAGCCTNTGIAIICATINTKFSCVEF